MEFLCFQPYPYVAYRHLLSDNLLDHSRSVAYLNLSFLLLLGEVLFELIAPNAQSFDLFIFDKRVFL